MRSTALALVGGLLACLTNPAGSFSAEPDLPQPTLAPLQATGQSVEERLDRLELQVRLIGQHLGIRFVLPPTAPDTDATSPSLSTSNDRLTRLEEKLDQLQQQLDGKRALNQAVPVSTQGRLVVQNLTGVAHYLSVNQVRYYVQPGRTDIWVPHQVVEVYLPWHESPKLFGMSLWKWTGRDYEMRLDVRN